MGNNGQHIYFGAYRFVPSFRSVNENFCSGSGVISLPRGDFCLQGPKGDEITRSLSNKACRFHIPIAFFLDGMLIADSFNKDQTYDSNRNTIETVSSILGGWGFGHKGGHIGAFIGTSVYPGFGTFIGGIIGGFTGAIVGSQGIAMAVSYLSDQLGIDIIRKACRACGDDFTVRLYRGETNYYMCPYCRRRR